MSENGADAVDAFRQCFERTAPQETLDAWLDDAVWLAPPTYLNTRRGRRAVQRLLAHGAAAVDGLRYERVWQRSDSAVLQFEAQVDGLALRGVDILHLDDAGQITGVQSWPGRQTPWSHYR
jgi:hypothetical protein